MHLLLHLMQLRVGPRTWPRTPKAGKKKAERYLLVTCTNLYTHYLLGETEGVVPVSGSSSAGKYLSDKRNAAYAQVDSHVVLSIPPGIGEPKRGAHTCSS